MWTELVESGRRKERGITNRLIGADIRTIIGTLDYFGVSDQAKKQVALDLKFYGYKTYDALGMWLRHGMGVEAKDDNNNIWVAFANIYVNVTYASQFVDYLRYMDLELDQGKWNSPEFVKKIRQWNSDDLKFMRRR